ncbi:hypothetical protein ACT3TD_14575 [Corynebacterium sp. AOP36-E1-14]|uniref:hypothetical protein n=1 Tax=unclassified Corynebacterium TaxID=2624378 RepID=UPI004034B703
MSWQTAVGRFYQLNPEALKAERLAEVRCNRGCLLATAVQLAGERVTIVHTHTTNSLPPTGVNAAAPTDTTNADALAKRIATMTGTDLFEALRAGEITEAQLEGLYRATGDLRQISYLATRADMLSGGNAWTFTRCKHVRGYLTAEHYNHSRNRPLKVSALPTEWGRKR